MRQLSRLAACALALGLAGALLAAPGCTLFDDWPEGGLKGSPFTPDQPEAAVTLTGEMYSNRIVEAGDGCVPGGTFFWGQVTNTGDLDVTNVSISITVYDAAGNPFGSWSGQVFNGEVDEADPDNPLAGNSLVVKQSGSFNVCTSVPFGSAASTGYRTSFTPIEGTSTQ
jgi:hypothetical protein